MEIPPPAADVKGLSCRKCGWRRVRVLYTRPAYGERLRRRRQCRRCAFRFTTYEAARR